MFDVDFKLKNETDFTIKVFTMIEGEYAPAVMILKPNEEMLHFKPSIGEISISVMAKRSSEIEQLRKDYALAWENHLLHEQIFVLTEAKIEQLQEALVEIVYQIGQGNNMAAMDIAAPIAAAYIQQKGE